jgi:hypothetical protein
LLRGEANGLFSGGKNGSEAERSGGDIGDEAGREGVHLKIYIN